MAAPKALAGTGLPDWATPQPESGGESRRAQPFLPAPTLPTGGGAIRGMGERFSTSPSRGTGGLTVPLAVSPGRGGATPALALTYDSGAGSSVFGLGFSVALPSVSRRTARGVPRYTDDDTFQLAGVGELVPALRPGNGDDWLPDEVTATIDGQPYLVRRYRPRVEGAFVRVEHCAPAGGGTPFWRTVSRDNVTSVFGRTAAARVAAPGLDGGPERVAEWLLEEVRDDRGEVTRYEYKAEDLTGVDPGLLYERHRLDGPPPVGRYLKRVRYANVTPGSAEKTCLLVVFDYGEHNDGPDEVHPWPVRTDPYSSYRNGFELRTWRLCRRVLMFHDFGEALGPGPLPRLVRATELTHAPDPVATKLVAVRHTGYQWVNGGYVSKSRPPLELGYTVSTVDVAVRGVGGHPVPGSGGVHWVDLDGDGLPGALTRTPGAWWYQRNAGGGTLEAPRVVESTPILPPDEPLHLADVDGDGALSIVHYGPSLFGTSTRTDGGWDRFTPFTDTPAVDFAGPRVHQVDLDGDGLADLLIGTADGLWWHRSLGRAGYGPAQWQPGSGDEERGPRLAYADAARAILFADLSGDGLADIVRIRDGEVCYWPNLGHGRFGAKVTMAGAPLFDHADQFDPARIRLADVDGSGPLDLVYLGRDAVRVWPNLAGNGFGPPRELAPFPAVDRLTAVDVVDLLGTGTRCLVWASPLPAEAGMAVRYLDLSRGKDTGLPVDDPRLAGWKPHLLCEVRNNTGATTRVEYAPSTRFHLADRAAGRPWVTRLPFPVQVVAGLTVTEAVSGARLTTRYAYRNGHFDGVERELRGFGMVETVDAESFPGPPQDVTTLNLPPVRTRRWFHVGTDGDLLADRWAGDPAAASLAPDRISGARRDVEHHDALRSLAGAPLRTEVFADDGGPPHPVSVVSHRHLARLVQPAGQGRPAVFLPYELETLTYHYERDPADPRVGHAMTIEVDSYGVTRSAVSIGYPRRNPAVPEQAATLVAWVCDDVAHTDTVAAHRIGVPVQARLYEVTGLSDPGTGTYAYESVAAALPALAEVPYEGTPLPDTASRRLVDRARVIYWADDLSGPLPFGQTGFRALTHRTDRLAFTPGLLAQVYAGKVDPPMLTNEGGYVQVDGDWWAPSDVQGYDPAGFYQPASATSPFGNTATVRRDPFQLFVVEAVTSQTAPHNVLVTRAVPDYRVMSPREVTDPNGNRSRVDFDALGMVTAAWTHGRAGDGDPDPLPGMVVSYDLDAWRLGKGPVWAHTETRERHGDPGSPWQRTRVYTDGLGRAALAKAQAEPGLAWTIDGNGAPVQVDTAPAVRWVGTGRTVYNNKALPVEQYEPYFSATLSYEDSDALVKQGATAVRHYDALGRAVRIDLPDGTFARVELDPWRHRGFDPNDTVLASRWYAERQGGATPPAQARAATLAAAHAGTPTEAVLDSLGRPVRLRTDNGPDGGYETVVALDIEGATVAVTDARGRTVHRAHHDALGRALRTVSADAGTVLTFPDWSGAPVRSWTANGHTVRYGYDPLRRPTHVWVRDPGAPKERLTALTVYGDGHPQGADRNLLGRPHRHYDQAGRVIAERLDFHGNLRSGSRTLAVGDPDWAPLDGAALAALDGLSTGLLDTEVFTTSAEYDALNRPTRQKLPDGTVVETGYNPAGLLETLAAQPGGAGPVRAFVTGASYDAHRRRLDIAYGNGVWTEYGYDEHSRRLSRLVSRRGGDRLQDLTYTYDPVGNIVEITDAAQQTVFFAGAVAAPVTRYTYDAIYRLRTASGREHASLTGQPDHTEPQYAPLPHPNDAQALRPYTQTYGYDEVGNLTSVQHAAGGSGSWTRTFQYAPDANRLLAHSRPGDPPGGPYSATFSYDAAGNMTRLPHLPDGLDWNAANQLTTVHLPDGTADYRYDAAGTRLHRRHQHTGGLVEEHICLGAYEIYRRRRNGTLVFERRTVQVNDGGQRVALVETVTVDTDHPGFDGTPALRYQLSNHLGSAVLECDGQGQVISYEEYHPFGTTSLWLARGAATTSLKRYRYLGKEKDEETGLYRLGVRYYACWLGRFTACDPGGLVDGPNLYRYSRDNPVRLADPGGMTPRETGESVSVTIPFIERLKQKGITRWAREVPYEVTVNGETVAGKFDLVYEDPALAQAGQPALVTVEAKRKPGSPWTPGQKKTIPAMQAGAKVTITGPAEGPGQLPLTKGMTIDTTGGKFVLVHTKNFGAVTLDKLGHLPDVQRYYTISTVDAQGRYEARSFTTPEELMEFHKARVNPTAGVLGGQTTTVPAGKPASTPAKPTPDKPATGSPKPGAREPDHFGAGPGDASTGPGGTRLDKFLNKSVEHGPALALAAEGIIDYFTAKTKEQKFDAIMKIVTAVIMSPAVQRSLDPMLSAAAVALGEGLLSFASRFSSGLLLLAPKDLTNLSRDPDEVYTH